VVVDSEAARPLKAWRIPINDSVQSGNVEESRAERAKPGKLSALKSANSPN
jgi:hypothetical protein